MGISIYHYCASIDHLYICFRERQGALANHLETVIRDGDDWKYLLPEEQPSQEWRLLLFDDTAWDTGPSGFGYGDGDDATVVDTTVSVFIRKVFTVDDLDNINSLYLHVDYDDAFIAYLNDYEIARANIGQPWTPVSFDETADQNHEAVIYSGGSPELFTVHNFHDLLFPARISWLLRDIMQRLTLPIFLLSPS